MSKQPIDESWFAELIQTDLKQCLQKLSRLKASVETIVDFGCFNGSEPFALLWTLDATEIVVVEKEEEHLTETRGECESLKGSPTGYMEGRSVRFIVADMTAVISELSSEYFDLAYCANVLYYMTDDPDSIRSAIDEIARVVKPGGYAVAYEKQLNQRQSEDVDSLFENAGLVRVQLTEDDPFWIHSY